MPGISTIANLTPGLTVLVPGCPTNMLAYALRVAIRRFFDKSQAWRESVDVTTTLDGNDDVNTSYTLTLTNTEAFILRIMNVWLLDANSDPARSPLLEHKYTLDREPPAIVFDAEHVPAQEDLVYRVQMSIAPKLNSSDLPAHLLELWSEGFIAGAVADLLSMPQKAWSNPGAASYWRSIEGSFIGKAKKENTTKGTTRANTFSA